MTSDKDAEEIRESLVEEAEVEKDPGIAAAEAETPASRTHAIPDTTPVPTEKEKPASVARSAGIVSIAVIYEWFAHS